MKTKFLFSDMMLVIFTVIFIASLGSPFYVMYKFEKRKEEFFVQLAQRSMYREGCMNAALNATSKADDAKRTYIDHLSDAIDSDGYKSCLRSESRYPALE